MSREGSGRVKNRAPAAIQVRLHSSLPPSPPHSLTHSLTLTRTRAQITAEQLLREAADFQGQAPPKPKQRVEDLEELHEYRARKRQEFEEVIRRTRSNVSVRV